MLISRHASSINQSTIQLACKSNQIKFVYHLKLLGVYLDRHFAKHAAEVKRKVNFKCHLISRAESLYRFRNFISKLFKLFVLPRFHYCSYVYFGNLSKAVLLQMEKCINKASKQVLNVRSNGLDLGEQLSKLSLFDILLWKMN